MGRCVVGLGIGGRTEAASPLNEREDRGRGYGGRMEKFEAKSRWFYNMSMLECVCSHKEKPGST